MSDEFEAAGTAIEGGLLARAVEKKAGEAKDENAGHCLNCETPVTSRYCSNCGQPLRVHRTFGAFWHDIVHSVLHFEGKFWRTIPLLAWHPGKLTRRYIHGERAKFVSPMALFLFSIFMMFAVFSFIGSPFSNAAAAGSNGEFKEGVAFQAESLDKQLAEKEAELAQATGPDKVRLEQEILDMKKGRNLLATMTGEDMPHPDVKLADGAIEVGNYDTKDLDQLQTGMEDIQEGNILNEDSSITTGSTELDQRIMSAIKKVNENPDLLLYKLQANGYKFAWLLIPISLPFIWLTMIGRRGYGLYDHAVFATYSIAFMSLLFITAALLAAFGASPAIWASMIMFFPPFHMYRQLRHAYELSRPEALARVLFLFVFTFISLTLFFLILLTLGVLG